MTTQTDSVNTKLVPLSSLKAFTIWLSATYGERFGGLSGDIFYNDVEYHMPKEGVRFEINGHQYRFIVFSGRKIKGRSMAKSNGAIVLNEDGREIIHAPIPSYVGGFEKAVKSAVRGLYGHLKLQDN